MTNDAGVDRLDRLDRLDRVDGVDGVDLRDRRGRLMRFVAAVAVGLVLTMLGMRGILAISVEPNTDPVGASTPALLAIAMFVVTASFTLKVLTTLARRARPAS